MAKTKSRGLMDRLYRGVLVFAAAFVFGLLLYWLIPDVTPYIGQTGAALWSWLLIIASGMAAHRMLPRIDLSPVSGVLFGLFTGAAVAMFFAFVFAQMLNVPFDDGELPQALLFVGFSALVLASILFIPIHLAREKLGGKVVVLCLLSGVVFPAGCILLWRPLGSEEFLGNALFAGLASLVGGGSAIGFSIATSRFRGEVVKSQ